MKPKPILFSIRKVMPIEPFLERALNNDTIFHSEVAKKEFAEYVANAFARRILHDFDKLVEYKHYEEDGEIHHAAWITIMGDDTEYENETEERRFTDETLRTQQLLLHKP